MREALAKASTELPPLPAECRTTAAHAILAPGKEIRAVLKRERKIVDRLNAKILRCAGFYDNVRTVLADPDFASQLY